MRIGIDARMYRSQFTGIGRYVYELTSRLFEMDPQHEYVLFMNEPEYSAFKSPRKGVRAVCVDVPHYSLGEQTRFLWALLKERLDVMHFTHFNAPILYWRPSVVTIHDLTLSFFPGKKMTRWIHRLGYNLVIRASVWRAKKIIAVSKNTKRDLQRLFRVRDQKIAVIYEGVGQEFHEIKDTQKLNKVRHQYGLREPFLLYTGVWRNHKNVVTAIDAFKQMVNDGFDGNLVITGREDPHYPEVKARVKQHGLEKQVVFTGLVPESDLIALYNAASVYIFPSFYEGFGLSPLEAMACGTPVVASNASCIPEICGEANALFCDPHHPKDFAQAAQSILQSSSKRETLIQNGRKRVRDFSWQSMAQETLEVYNQVA